MEELANQAERIRAAGLAVNLESLSASETARRRLPGVALTADRSAVSYLNKTHQSPKGLLTTFEHLQRSIALISWAARIGLVT